MDISILTALVGELGFPIAITIALFKQNKETSVVMEEMNLNLTRLTILIEELRKENLK